MAIRCEHVHRLDCGSQLNFGLLWQRSKCVSRISYFEHACPKLNFVLISHLTGKCATQHLKNLRIFSLWTCSHLMTILRSQNINTDCRDERVNFYINGAM